MVVSNIQFSTVLAVLVKNQEDLYNYIELQKLIRALNYQINKMKPVQSKFSRPTTAKKVQKPEKAPSKTMSPTYSGQDGNISELMEQLIISQKQCEKSGKYVEAQGFKRKVKALQEQLQKRDMIEIRNKHEHERQSIQQAHLEQLNCFNIEWSEKIAQLEHAVKEMENELISKHEEQLRVVEEEIDGQKPYKFKQSAQLLNLKKIQQQLAKQQNYMQAHQVQLRAQKLQKQQFERWKQLQSTKSKTNLNILKQKQQNELNALKQRIDLMFEQKSQQKHQEQQAIMLKYQNVLKELEYQQKQEVMRFEKTIKLKGMQKKTKFGLMSASKVSLQ